MFPADILFSNSEFALDFKLVLQYHEFNEHGYWVWRYHPYSLTAQILQCYLKCSICSFNLNQDHSIRKSKITVSGSIFRYNKTWLSNQTNSNNFVSMLADTFQTPLMLLGDSSKDQQDVNVEGFLGLLRFWTFLQIMYFIRPKDWRNYFSLHWTLCVFSISFKHENTDILGID